MAITVYILKVIVILAFIEFSVYVWAKIFNPSFIKSRSGNDIDTQPQPLVDKNQIKQKITEYFDQFSRDRSQYELYGFYKRQFDLDTKGYNKSYSKGVREIGSLYDLGLQEFEIESGRTILKELVNKLSNTDSSRFTESKCIIFLNEYHEISGKLNALDEIKNIVTDTERFENYSTAEENKKIEIINNLSE